MFGVVGIIGVVICCFAEETYGKGFREELDESEV